MWRPREFSQLWFDTLAIPKDAPHPDLAMQFINFMLQPDVIAGVTNVVHYPNAVPRQPRQDHPCHPRRP